MATPDPTQDLLDPNTPKKKPAASAVAMGTGVQGPNAGGAAMPSAFDTGVPPPTSQPEAIPQPAAQPASAPLQSGGVESVPAGVPQPAAPAPPPVAAPPPAPVAAPGIAPQEAQRLVNEAMIARVGHPLTPQEQAGLSQAVGAPAGPNGTYTQAQIDQALDLVGRYSGNIADPYGPLAESAPGSTTSLANKRLTELLNLDFDEVDPNSQAIQQPLGAFRSAQSRAGDRARMGMALRNQREGITGGGEETGLLGLLEEQGQNEASFTANLYAQELGARREQLSEAVQLATQAGLQNKARELQAELGKLDIELRRYLGQGQLALGARSLDQNDQQFLERMGFNYANLQGQLNNQAILALLG